jgi:hypothetical protein
MPIEDYQNLIKDGLRYIAALNCLNRVEAPREALAAAEQELVDLWRQYNDSLETFDDLVKFQTNIGAGIYKEQLIKEYFDNDEETEYELYCK